MQKSNGFNLIELIIIMIITALVSIIATGVIMLKSDGSKSINFLSDDENLQEFINVYNTILNKYYSNDIDKKGLLSAAEDGMLNFLGDKYTTYLNDEEYNDILDELSADYEGIGLGIEGNIVMTVTPNGPAEKAGIKVGDLITRIDGVEVDSTDQVAIKSYIRDKNNKEVELEITRDGIAYEYTLQKEK